VTTEERRRGYVQYEFKEKSMTSIPLERRCGILRTELNLLVGRSISMEEKADDAK
jgi:hypothetical protein